MKNIFKRLLPKKDQEKQVDLRVQVLYKLAVHPSLFNEQESVADLLLTYQQSVEACIKEAIDKNKDKIGYIPFKTHAKMSSIFCDNTDKDNFKYLLIKFNIFYADVELCKYIVEMLTIKTISIDEYLDYYNEGLKCGMIPTENKQ
jgi:hypothetical protein